MAYNRKRKELSWADLVSRPGIVEEDAATVSVPASSIEPKAFGTSIDDIINGALSNNLKLQKVTNNDNSIPMLSDTVVQEQTLQASPELNGEPRVVDNKIAIEYPSQSQQSPVQSLLANYLPDVKSEQVRRILQNPESPKGILSAFLPAAERDAASNGMNFMNNYMPQQNEGQFARDAFSTIGLSGDDRYPPATPPYGAPGTENFARPDINDVSSMNNQQMQQNNSGGGIFSRIADWAKRNDVGNRINDYALGLSMGSTPSESAALGAQNLYRGNIGRNEAHQAEQEALQSQQQQNQTLKYLQSQGYDDTQSSLILSDPKLLSSVLTNSLTPTQESAIDRAKLEGQLLSNERTRQDIASRQSTPAALANLPPPQAGYRYQFDQNTGEPILVPIAGGPAAREIEANERSKEAATGSRAERAAFGLDAIQELKRIYNEPQRGVISRLTRGLINTERPLSGFSSTIADYVDPETRINIESQQEALQSLVAGDLLAQAKQNSPNGASGYGNLSNAEYIGLANSIAALRYGMSPEAYRRSLDRIEAYLNKAAGINNSNLPTPQNGEINFVNVLSPNGKVYEVPAEEVDDAVRNGGKVVGNGQ